VTHRFKHAVSAAVLIAIPQGAPALPDGGLSAGYVQDLCSSTKEAEAVACTTYFRGMLEGLTYGYLASDGYPTFCLPSAGIDAGEARSMFLRTIRRQPDRRLHDAAILILAALENRYPCGGEDDLGGAIFGLPGPPTVDRTSRRRF
jgi:hypothetical protein